VARSAIDVVALLAALESLQVYWKRKRFSRLSGDLAFVEVRVFPKLPPRNRSWNQRSRRASIREKGAGLEGLVLWLIVHVLSAAGYDTQQQES
jgi:hypothetical protein